MNGEKAAASGRKIELDFVRGLAILCVLGEHFRVPVTTDAFTSGANFLAKTLGGEGVNLFFALSGFLVGGLLLKQFAESGRIDAWRFIIRRLFKIWPAYYALILFQAVTGHHPLNTFLLPNLLHVQNYLGTSINQTWSLAVEEHFYLFLPLLLMLSARVGTSGRSLTLLLLGLCSMVFMARCGVVYKGDLRAAFAYTQYRIDSLLFGVILAALYWLLPSAYAAIARRKYALLAAVAVLAACLVASYESPIFDRTAGYSLQAIGFCAFIVLVIEYSGRVASLWLYRAVAWLGVYSYGIYLWHSLALAPGAWAIRKFAAIGVSASLSWVLALCLQFVIAVAVGYVMTRIIEFPMLRLRETIFPRRRHAETCALEGARS